MKSLKKPSNGSVAAVFLEREYHGPAYRDNNRLNDGYVTIGEL